MRTVVFVGLLSIAFAINSDAFSDESINCFAWIILVSIVMDLTAFIYKILK